LIVSDEDEKATLRLVEDLRNSGNTLPVIVDLRDHEALV
jgi:hypothetical protein